MFVYMYCKAFLKWPHQLLLDALEINFIIIIIIIINIIRYLAYLDDILIYSRTEKEHSQLLEKAFKCLLKAGLKIKLSKYSLHKEQMNHLGHLVSGTSILPLADKIEVLMKLKHPNNIKEV